MALEVAAEKWLGEKAVLKETERGTSLAMMEKYCAATAVEAIAAQDVGYAGAQLSPREPSDLEEIQWCSEGFVSHCRQV